MHKSLFLPVVMLLMTASAQAVPRSGASGDACTEMFNECLRGCGPKPGSNPACEKQCEEVVLAKCKSGAAAKDAKGAPKVPVKPKVQPKVQPGGAETPGTESPNLQPKGIQRY